MVAGLRDGDCLVVTSKVVSKAEGRVITVPDVKAKQAAIASEARRVLRRRGDLVITETRHGHVCANAGVDLSNAPDGMAVLLPEDPDRSARRIRDVLRARGLVAAVVISDTFGRPWRRGVVDVALGVAGLSAVIDLRGTLDTGGRPLEVTEIAIADEIAAAAELVMGKARGVPAAVISGLDPSWLGPGSGADLIRPPHEDLFR
ncbi:MAG: coenzyme F420-0:L-glutamate ligase [Actinobacteria bacterium]|nr:coenzyme F420-0:L-glutamate ligase [Actinomycetota bacterium]